MVRINQLPLGLADLEEIVPQAPDLLLIPKTETPEEVLQVDEAVHAVLPRNGSEREIWLMPILETALGIERAYDIGRASPRVVALTLGLEDLTADLGVVKTPQGEETLYARRRLVIAARAARVVPIDSVYGDVEDLEGLRSYAQRSRAMGFEGMGCLHPRQIPVLHEAWAPSPTEIEKAMRIMAAYAEAEARGESVVSLGSKMIDPPVVKRARRVVDEAGSLGLLPESAPGAAGG
jgi:citrate lyase subunit beta/citryl-CoA lyase